MWIKIIAGVVVALSAVTLASAKSRPAPTPPAPYVVDSTGAVVGVLLGFREDGAYQEGVVGLKTTTGQFFALALRKAVGEGRTHFLDNLADHAVSFDGPSCTGNAFVRYEATSRSLVPRGARANGMVYVPDLTAAPRDVPVLSYRLDQDTGGTVCHPGGSTLRAVPAIPTGVNVSVFVPPFRLRY